MKKALLIFSLVSITTFAQDKKPVTPTIEAGTIGAFSFRAIGPSLTSGRVGDLAVHPTNSDCWLIAAASGGIWRTTNHGQSFSPVFDSYGSYSIGCVKFAPSNPNTVWVGTGENNNQRSVSYGDGVYKSLDGGKTYQNMGLKTSEHIGNIVIHPTNENIVWVAAYGPLWSKGAERGIYKTIDGGKTWERTLFVSDDTGFAEIAIDPSNPEILYATSHQRRRSEASYVGGGPESSVYKSTDGGKTWREITVGLPKGEMGRIGISVSPVDPNIIYIIVEARYEKGGVFISNNKGENWSKQNSFSTSGNYYQELYCDPTNKERVFAMDTYLNISTNSGKTFSAGTENTRHVDNHCIWVDEKNSEHWLLGCDGGLYETYSNGKQWHHFQNLPITQFYKVATDTEKPIYNVYGGTQDNNSMFGPETSRNDAGVTSSDWQITLGGDGFESAIDHQDPNIAYSQYQYGGLARIDRKSGERMMIQPIPGKGEAAYRWNWDAPIVVSKHNSKTIYFAANKLFKSENRGDDWKTISPDLTQQIDRSKEVIMGQVWSMDAVMKNASTTIYGNIIALDESPKKQGLLYVGTDDGCIQISENDGTNWNKVTTFAGVPANTRVNMLTASSHNENEVFAAFNNQRNGDFKPYLFKSSNKGKTWVSITGNLPERGTVYCIKQDPVNANLLFVGTEFGAFTSLDGGKKWLKLSGLPCIAVYDLDIQAEECDLVAATFGRGFYVLDNYKNLRSITDKQLESKVFLLSVDTAELFVPANAKGILGNGAYGADVFVAENQNFGANFYFYQKEVTSSMKEIRMEKEKALEKDKKAVEKPSFETLQKEANQIMPKNLWIIRDVNGKEVKKIEQTPQAGISKITWNLRMENSENIAASRSSYQGKFASGNDAFLVPEGDYTVEVVQISDSAIEYLVPKTKFVVKNVSEYAIPSTASSEFLVFKKEMNEINRTISGSLGLYEEAKEKLQLMEAAIKFYPNTDLQLLKEIYSIQSSLNGLRESAFGQEMRLKHEDEGTSGFIGRFNTVFYQMYESTYGPTKTQKSNAQIVNEELTQFRNALNGSLEKIEQLEKQLDTLKIPYTKGKDKSWKEN